MAEGALLAACLAAYGGFGLLALSMSRHWRDLAGSRVLPVGRRRGLRWAGALALATSIALAVWREGAGFGSVLGVMQLSGAAVAVALTLSARPRWLCALAAGLAGRGH